MNCKRAKQSMALSVGRDLEDGSDRDLQRHIAACPPCRDYLGRLRKSTSILQQAREDSCEPLPDDVTLWPSIARAIQKPARRPSPFTWTQAWVPVVAIASMVLAIISISNTLSYPPPDGNLIFGPGGAGAATASQDAGGRNHVPEPEDSNRDRPYRRNVRD